MTSQLADRNHASLNASHTIAVFDAQAATDWIPTKPAATKAQISGHPAEIMRGLSKGEEITAIDVGASSGYAFELEGWVAPRADPKITAAIRAFRAS